MRIGLALALGFGLSVIALGLLWVGTPWPLQALMGLAFAAAAWGLSRGAASRDPGQALGPALALLCGAAPIGLVLVQFRTPDGSHGSSIAVVLAWVAGTAAGAWLPVRTRR